MNNLFLLVLISIILVVYGWFKVLSILWLCFLILPRQKLTPYEKAKQCLQEIQSYFPDYPDLDIINRYINTLNHKSTDKSTSEIIDEEYIFQILDDLYFIKPNTKSILENFRIKLIFLRKLFSD